VLYQLSYAHHVGALKPRELEVIPRSRSLPVLAEYM